jgi:stearoyl-CoA 9-desaturase NADPH oxidoreductase
MSTATAVSRTVSATQRVASWLKHLGISEYAFDDTISLVNPLLTVHRLHAQVIAKVQETPSACTVVLQAGPAFAGLTPGQYVMVGVSINGTRCRRAYSPRSVNGSADRFAITVQRQAHGKVSNHIHDRIKVGDVIEIEQSAGEFTLPTPAPSQVLMMAGGSGITPIMSMIEHLKRTQSSTRITLVYFARSEADRIFADSLSRLAKEWPQLNYQPVVSEAFTGDQTVPQPALSPALLDDRMPGWRGVSSYCCGPAPLMDAARAIWQEAGLMAHLKLEAFAPNRPTGDANARHQIRIQRGEQAMAFDAPGNQTLLESGEKAGHALKHGCRQGICHECTCRLNSGSIKDLTTGEQIDGNGQTVRLCVTTALSDLDMQALS